MSPWVVRAALACGLFLAPCHSLAADGQGERPHIVLVLVDDLGWLDHSLAVPGGGPPSARPFRTPHLERLAREGVVVPAAYAAAPVCSPTRVSLMTGQHPARHGVTYWTLHGGRDTSAAHPRLVPPPWRSDSLQPGDVTLPALLRGAGYHTIHVGKAHFGARGTPGADPCALGFEVNLGGHAAGGPGSYLGRDQFSAAKRAGAPANADNSVWDVPGLAAYHGQDVFLTDALAAEGARALEAGLASGRPVFLHFAPYAVHAPIMANERVADRVPEGLDPRERAYATMVVSIDDALGTLLEVLDRRGAREDTLVIFTSDNGGLSAHGRGGEAHTHNRPLASGKGSALEGGVRVPLVLSWPGRLVPRGTLLNAWVTQDLFPTLLEAAGVAVASGHVCDGLSQWPLLTADATEEPGLRVLWWHMPHTWGPTGPGIEPFSALVRDHMKLIHYHDGGAPRAGRDPRAGRLVLYDLAADVAEERDLVTEQPDLTRELATELAARQRAAKVGLSRLKATGEPVLDALATYEALAPR